jgi:hypothetical protein
MERYEYSVPYQPLRAPSQAYLANYDRIFKKNKDLGDDPRSGAGGPTPPGTSGPPADAVTGRRGPDPLEKRLTAEANAAGEGGLRPPFFDPEGPAA